MTEKETPKTKERKPVLNGLVISIGAVVCLGVILLVSFSTSGGKKKHIAKPDEDLKRKTYSESLVGDFSKPSDNELSEALEKPEAQESKRNLKTKMGVFIKQEERKEEGAKKGKTKKRETKGFGIPSGTRVSALLTHRLFSFNLEAPVLAKTMEDVSVKGKCVIPKGTLLLGEASVLKSVDRINIRFDKFILPGGKEVQARAMALSSDGSSGLKGKVDKHRDKTIFKAMGETVLGGVALFSGGLNSSAYTLQDQMKLNASQGLVNMAEKDLNEVKTESSITVEAFTPFQILFLERV